MVTEKLPENPPSSNGFMLILLLIYRVLEGTVLAFIPMMFLPKKAVQNQLVLITGAGSGIGRLLAIRFAKLGSRLALWDINKDGLEKTISMISADHGSFEKYRAYQVDLCQRESIYRTAKLVEEEMGSVDILINNAGVISGKLILDIPDSSIEQTFRVNTLAHFYTIKAFLPGMVKRRNGHIVTIASMAGVLGVPYQTDYSASKFANIGMDWALRMELVLADLTDIKTTLVKPYFINTGMFEGVKLPFFMPILDQNYVADQIVLAIRTNQTELFLPKNLAYSCWLLYLIPMKAHVPFLAFISGFTQMKHFTGRNVEKN